MPAKHVADSFAEGRLADGAPLPAPIKDSDAETDAEGPAPGRSAGGELGLTLLAEGVRGETVSNRRFIDCAALSFTPPDEVDGKPEECKRASLPFACRAQHTKEYRCALTTFSGLRENLTARAGGDTSDIKNAMAGLRV